MKGIILAGGLGTRLYPVTKSVSKQLLNVYDKPMIYYPLSVLMLTGIREILVITTPYDQNRFQNLLGDGSQWGVRLSYLTQFSPDGLAQAFILGEDFIEKDPVCLILGDNIFYGQGLSNILMNAQRSVVEEQKATVFGAFVTDPQRYGVAEFDEEGQLIDIKEKPDQPKSHYAISGLYFYPNSVIETAKSLKPSSRKELEITEINQRYLKRNQLVLEKLGRGYTWLDAGTHDSLLDASILVRALEQRQGLKIACLEEIAFEKGYISREDVLNLSVQYQGSTYGQYLKEIGGGAIL